MEGRSTAERNEHRSPKIGIAVAYEGARSGDPGANENVLASPQTATITETRIKSRRSSDPYSSPQTLNQASISRCTSVQSSLRTPKAPPTGGRQERKDISRSPGQGGGREGEKDRELRRFAARTFDENVRHSSADETSDVEKEPHSVPAPLAGTQELCIGSPTGHQRSGRAPPGRVRVQFVSSGPLKPGSSLPQMPNEVTRLAGGGL